MMSGRCNSNQLTNKPDFNVKSPSPSISLSLFLPFSATIKVFSVHSHWSAYRCSFINYDSRDFFANNAISTSNIQYRTPQHRNHYETLLRLFPAVAVQFWLEIQFHIPFLSPFIRFGLQSCGKKVNVNTFHSYYSSSELRSVAIVAAPSISFARNSEAHNAQSVDKYKHTRTDVLVHVCRCSGRRQRRQPRCRWNKHSLVLLIKEKLVFLCNHLPSRCFFFSLQ